MPLGAKVLLAAGVLVCAMTEHHDADDEVHGDLYYEVGGDPYADDPYGDDDITNPCLNPGDFTPDLLLTSETEGDEDITCERYASDIQKDCVEPCTSGIDCGDAQTSYRVHAVAELCCGGNEALCPDDTSDQGLDENICESPDEFLGDAIPDGWSVTCYEAAHELELRVLLEQGVHEYCSELVDNSGVVSFRMTTISNMSDHCCGNKRSICSDVELMPCASGEELFTPDALTGEEICADMARNFPDVREGEPCSEVTQMFGEVRPYGIFVDMFARACCQDSLSVCPSYDSLTPTPTPTEPECDPACPSGRVCDSSTCICAPGRFGFDCECALGWLSAEGGEACEPCEAGRSADIGDDTCEDCPAGKFSHEGSQCEDCRQGSYSAAAGAEDCTACAANTHLSSSGSSGPCEACGEGEIAPAGSAYCVSEDAYVVTEVTVSGAVGLAGVSKNDLDNSEALRNNISSALAAGMPGVSGDAVILDEIRDTDTRRLSEAPRRLDAHISYSVIIRSDSEVSYQDVMAGVQSVSPAALTTHINEAIADDPSLSHLVLVVTSISPPQVSAPVVATEPTETSTQPWGDGDGDGGENVNEAGERAALGISAAALLGALLACGF